MGATPEVEVAVAEPAAIASPSLVRQGATTHSSHAARRLIDLPPVFTGARSVTARLPGSATLLLPGGPLLLVLDPAGRR